MKPATLLVIALLSCLPAAAGPERIAIWNGPAPGTEGRADTEQVADNGNIAQVFQPELVFFPAPAREGAAPAVLVCPGGGYLRIVMAKEGGRVARWLNRRGFAVFVLKYRLQPGEAVQDARRAVRVIRRRAAEFGIDPARVGVMGFSAGGHLCASLAINHAVTDVADETDGVSARPDFCALVYGIFEALKREDFAPGSINEAMFGIPSIKDSLPPDMPPVFLAHAADDRTVPVGHSINLFMALKARGIPAEMHIYEKCGHGFALDPERGHATGWGDAFCLWLKARGMAPAPSGAAQ